MKFQFIPGPAGALQVLEEKPDGAPEAVAVICHPHPLHGGTLNNKVVHQLARSFSDLGAVSIRFNFRGVGGSEGEYDEGDGEQDDLIAVINWATARWPGLPLWLGGFSFGGFIAIKVARQVQPACLVSVAPAVNFFPDEDLQLTGIEWLLVQGDADDIVPVAEVTRWLDTLQYQPRLALLKDAGHFFHGRLNELRQVIIDAFEKRD